MRYTLLAVLLIAPMLSLSCKHPISKNECLTYFVAKELRSNPKIKQFGIDVSVRQMENGYVTLAIGQNDKYFSDATINALRSGQSLRDIQMFRDKSVSVLIEAEEVIKKLPEIKTVSWTADEQCPPGGACGSSRGNSMNSDTDYENQCSKYKK